MTQITHLTSRLASSLLSSSCRWELIDHLPIACTFYLYRARDISHSVSSFQFSLPPPLSLVSLWVVSFWGFLDVRILYFIYSFLSFFLSFLFGLGALCFVSFGGSSIIIIILDYDAIPWSFSWDYDLLGPQIFYSDGSLDISRYLHLVYVRCISTFSYKSYRRIIFHIRFWRHASSTERRATQWKLKEGQSCWKMMVYVHVLECNW